MRDARARVTNRERLAKARGRVSLFPRIDRALGSNSGIALPPSLLIRSSKAISTRATANSEITLTARTDDYDAIVRVMSLYIDAFNANDVSKLKEAFDDDAWIFYIDAVGSLPTAAGKP